MPKSVLSSAIMVIAVVIGATAHAQAPAPTSWSVDTAHSTLEFLYTQAGGKNTGHFQRFTGTIDFAPQNLAAAKADISVDLSSVTTGDADRDGSLRSEEWFNVAKFATARYLATQFVAKGTSFEARGDMSLHGVTRKAPATFTWGPATEAGQTVSWLKGSFDFKRTDFGVGGSDAESLKWLPADITVTFNLRLVPRAAAAPAAAPAQSAPKPAAKKP